MKTGRKFSKLLCPLIFCLSFSCEPQESTGDYTSIEGIYSCQESSSHSGIRKYFVEVDKVGNADNLYILTNFHNLGDTEFIYAELREGKLYLVNQAINNLSVNGEGPVDQEFRSIELSYTTDDGIILLEYYAQLSR